MTWKYLFTALATLEVARVFFSWFMYDHKHGGKFFGTNVEDDEEDFNIYD